MSLVSSSILALLFLAVGLGGGGAGPARAGLALGASLLAAFALGCRLRAALWPRPVSESPSWRSSRSPACRPAGVRPVPLLLFGSGLELPSITWTAAAMAGLAWRGVAAPEDLRRTRAVLVLLCAGVAGSLAVGGPWTLSLPG